MFPSGCFTACKHSNSTILGPQLGDQYTWDWLENQNSIGSGHGNVTPLSLTETAVYNLSIVNGLLCSSQTRDLNYTVTESDKCTITAEVKDVTLNDSKFCVSEVLLMISNTSTSPMPVTLTCPSNEVIISPTSVSLTGTQLYTFLFVPINGFIGATVNIAINGLNADGKPCVTYVDVKLSTCRVRHKMAAKESTTAIDSNNLLIAPNPSKGSTNISFANGQLSPQIEVYSLLGKLIAHYSATAAKGIWQLDTSGIAAGVYVVVMKENGEIIVQKKLIVE